MANYVISVSIPNTEPRPLSSNYLRSTFSGLRTTKKIKDAEQVSGKKNTIEVLRQLREVFPQYEFRAVPFHFNN